MRKKKLAWHTDIVVDGQGIGVKVKPAQDDACSVMTLDPDVPGKKADLAIRKFRKAVVQTSPLRCETRNAKNAVVRAVKKTGARWNGWHREAY